MKMYFLGVFSKNIQISNFINIGPLEAELFHADRQTNIRRQRHDESNSCFSQFSALA